MLYMCSELPLIDLKHKLVSLGDPADSVMSKTNPINTFTP